MVKGKVLSLSTPYGRYDVRVAQKSYAVNKALAVVLYYNERNEWLPYANITVNIESGETVRKYVDEDLAVTFGKRYACQYVDTNNCEWATRFLEENKIAFFTGCFADSGFCSYPLYAFDLEKLSELGKAVA